MKNFLILLAAVALFSCSKKQAESANVEAQANADTAVAQQSNQLSIESSGVEEALPQTTIKWDRATHDFGTIQEGEKVRTTFTITNTGDNPLIINNAKGSCGCTVPKVDKNVPIAPGATTEIEVEFNSKGRPGKNSKNVDLFGNFSPSPSRATITASVQKDESAAAATPAADPHAGHNH